MLSVKTTLAVREIIMKNRSQSSRKNCKALPLKKER